MPEPVITINPKYTEKNVMINTSLSGLIISSYKAFDSNTGKWDTMTSKVVNANPAEQVPIEEAVKCIVKEAYLFLTGHDCDIFLESILPVNKTDGYGA